MGLWSYILAVAIGYLLGSIPIGYLLGRAKGVDVRRMGSGRTGATNILRSAGILPAIGTLIGDAVKGIASILIARALGGGPVVQALTGLAALLGHTHSVFLKGRGGAGVMVNIGVISVFCPYTGLVLTSLGALVIALTRYASLASLVVSPLAPLMLLGFSLWAGLPLEYALYAFLSAALIVLEHRPNIQRLLAGTERRVGEKAKPIA